MSISVGLVGTGYWARTVHAVSLASHPEVTFRGVWGRNAANRESIASDNGVTAFASFDALLREVDIVDFAVAPEVQAPLAIAAARAGKDLLLEKPVALTVAETVELDQVVRAAGVHALVFMSRLFDPARRRWLDDQVGQGWLGGRSVIISSALTAGPYADSAWRRRDAAVIWDLGPHALSQLEHVLGPVVEATVLSHAARGATDLAFTHASGARSTALMTLYAQPSERTEAVEFTGSAGRSSSPEIPLDFLLGHASAVTTLVAQRPTAGRDAGQAGHTLSAAVRHTSILATVCRDLGSAGTPAPPDVLDTRPPSGTVPES